MFTGGSGSSINAAATNLTLPDDIIYIDAFRETWTHCYGVHVIDMGILNGTRTSNFTPNEFSPALTDPEHRHNNIALEQNGECCG